MSSKPLRKCIGCGEKKEKSEFLMIFRTPKSNLNTEFKVSEGKNKEGGRAAYICKNEKCLKTSLKAKKLERNFKTKMPENIYSTIERMIEDK